MVDDWPSSALALSGRCFYCIFNHGGEATTSRIRENAALDWSEIHYRYTRLTERGLIETYTATPPNGGQETTHARLTDEGRQAITDGLLDDITDANTNLRQLRREVSALANRVDEKEDTYRVSRRIADLKFELRQERSHSVYPKHLPVCRLGRRLTAFLPADLAGSR